MKRDPSLHVLQHALGLDDHGQGTWYRNHFVTGPGSKDWDMCMAHVDAGRMARHDPREVFGMSYCFTVTDAGIAYVREQSPAPPRLTRAQKRYREWLQSGADVTGLRFGEWLKTRPAHGR